MKNSRTNIGIIILNYLAYEETIKCTYDFLKQESNDTINYKIIIVDNYSSNDSYEILCQQFADNAFIKIIQTNKNIGYAGGNNLGYQELLKYMIPDFVVVSNEDIIIESSNLYSWIITCFKSYQFAVAGPSIFGNTEKFYQNPAQDYLIGDSECKMQLWRYQYLLKNHMSMILQPKSEVDMSQRDNHQHEIIYFNKVLHGSFLIFSHKYFTEYSEPFYPNTFLYTEEAFLWLRCISKNLLMVYDPSFKVIHLQAVSTNAACTQYQNRKLLKMEHEVESLKKYYIALRKEQHPVIKEKKEEAEKLFFKKNNKLYEFVDSKSKVYIYGAGYYGNECLYLLRGRKRKVAGFVVTDEKKEKNIAKELFVYGLNELLPLEVGEGIIVAVNKVSRDEMITNLEAFGINDYFIYPN